MRSVTAPLPKLVRSIALLLVVMCLFGAAPTTMISAQASAWHVKATLVPKGWTATTNAYLGWSLAMDGDTLVAGAPLKNKFVGAAEVFVRSGANWTWQAELAPKDGKSGDGFGWAVAIQGDIILVGAPHKANSTGGVYLFQRTGKTWAQQDFPQPQGLMPGDLFGWSIASAALPPPGPSATPAATVQAKLAAVHAKAGAVPSRSPTFQFSGNSIFNIPAQGSGEEFIYVLDARDSIIQHFMLGDGHQNPFSNTKYILVRSKSGDIIMFTWSNGGTLDSRNVHNEFAVADMDYKGNLIDPFTSHDIQLDPTTVRFGAMVVIPVIPPTAPSGASNGSSDVWPAPLAKTTGQTSASFAAQSTGPDWLLLEAPVNGSGVVSALNLYGLGDDGTVTALDNQPAAVGGVVYGYAGATNGTDIVLLGVDANKIVPPVPPGPSGPPGATVQAIAGSLGFYTIQANKLVAGAKLPFSADPFQTQDTGGASSFAFSSDGNTLIAATLDPKTHSEALAILEKS